MIFSRIKSRISVKINDISIGSLESVSKPRHVSFVAFEIFLVVIGQNVWNKIEKMIYWLYIYYVYIFIIGYIYWPYIFSLT